MIQEKIDPDKISFQAGVGQTSCTSNIGSAMSTRGTSSAPASFSFEKFPDVVYRASSDLKIKLYALIKRRVHFNKGSDTILLTNKEIFKEFGKIDPSTISRNLKKMAQLGWINIELIKGVKNIKRKNVTTKRYVTLLVKC